MIKKSVFIALFSLFNVFIGWAQTAHYNVVPLPKSIQYANAGDFILNSQTTIAYPKGNKALHQNAMLLAQYIQQSTGLQLKVVTKANDNSITLRQNLTSNHTEAYQL